MSQTIVQPNIFPILRYRDAPAAMSWLARAFGFETRMEVPGPDGTVAHAELRLGAGTIGVSSKTPPDGKNPWTTVDQGVYVSVDNPDAHHDRAKAAGATIETPLRDLDYGSREYSARDPGGHLWAFGTYRMTDAADAPNMYPTLWYEDAPSAVAWLERGFGFEKVVVIPGENGTIEHAELRLGPGVVMLSSSKPSDAAVLGGARQAVCVAIDDPDGHYATAVAAGARIIRPIETTHYGARTYSAGDVEGYVWTFGTYRPEL
jgi:uncharacterized glyoxalase superfamily protein PhnB